MSHVTIISRQHALAGQTLEVVALRSARGPTFLVVRLSDGRKRSIPRSITQLVAQPFHSSKDSIEAGLRVSVRTLIPLAKYLASRSTSTDVIGDGDPSGSAERRGIASENVDPQSRFAAPVDATAGGEQGAHRVDPCRDGSTLKAEPSNGGPT